MEALVVICFLVLQLDGCIACYAGVNKDMIVQLVIKLG